MIGIIGMITIKINENLEENISSFSISIVPADDLALLGTGSSADTVMTEYGHLKG